eukprot:694448-Rhodomonas_salina.1
MAGLAQDLLMQQQKEEMEKIELEMKSREVAKRLSSGVELDETTQRAIEEAKGDGAGAAASREEEDVDPETKRLIEQLQK